MKKIVFILLAITIASVSMAQVEGGQTEFSPTKQGVSLMKASPTSLDDLLLLDDSRNVKKNRAIDGLFVYFTETFDAIPGTNPWSISMTHDNSLGDLDWEIGTKEELDAVPMANGVGYISYMGAAVSEYSNSGGRFACLKAIGHMFANINSTNAKASHLRSYLTLGPFDFSQVENPAIVWDQIYRKFNRDETFIEYSTDNYNFTKVRVNDIKTGVGKFRNNIAFLPGSLAGKPQVYIRFTLEEVLSISPMYGSGYGWQVDDIAIVKNVDYEIAIGKIATNFYHWDGEKVYHITSTFGRMPKEELESAGLYFKTPFINRGNMAVKPMLTVTVKDPNGVEVYRESAQKTGDAVQTGKMDTLRIANEKGFEPKTVIPGRYDIRYEISIPDHEDELSAEDNVSETYFYVTDNGVMSRDLDMTTGVLAIYSWNGGGKDGEELGMPFYLVKSSKIYSVDLFIAKQTDPGNAISVSINTFTGNGLKDLVQESAQITITEDMLGTWINVPFNAPVQIEPPQGNSYKGGVFVKMFYTNPDNAKRRITIGADPSTKGSQYGAYYDFIGQGGFDPIEIASTAAMCVRLNTKPQVTNHFVQTKVQGGGSITPAGKMMVYPGESKTFVMKAIPNYEMVSVMLDNTSVMDNLVDGSYTLENIQANHEISVNYELIKHKITATAEEGGTISPAGDMELEQGSYKTFTIKPNEGFIYDKVFVNQVDVTGKVIATNGVYEFGPVLEPATITATFRQPSPVIIVATAGDGGSISPTGEQTFTEGQDVEFKFTPIAGFIINDVQVGGQTVDYDHENKSYTFVYLQAPDKTIDVSFKVPDKFKITASVNDSNAGTIDPDGVTEVEEGSDLSYTIAAKEGFQLDSIVVNDKNATAGLQNGVYKFINVHEHSFIKAFFSKQIFVLTVSAGPNGSITPNGEVKVALGGEQQFDISPKPGFKIGKLTLDGVDVPQDQIKGTNGDDATYTISNVSANHIINVTFVDKTSILEHALDIDVNIYPNPANDFINIEVSEEIKSVEILSIVGTTISKQNVNDNLFTYPTQELSNGNYIVRIHTSNNVVVKQFSVIK